MKRTESFWYDVASGSVERAEERPEGASLGPFATAEEAAEAPEMLMAHARAWLDSDAAQPYMDEARRAAEEDPEF